MMTFVAFDVNGQPAGRMRVDNASAAIEQLKSEGYVAPMVQHVPADATADEVAAETISFGGWFPPVTR